MQRYRTDDLRKFNEAEFQPQSAMVPWEQGRTLDKDRNFQLGVALFRVKNFREAEVLLQQTVESQERNPGENQLNIANSKYWLGVTLLNLDKFSEAKVQLEQAASWQDTYLGRDCDNTLRSKYWLGVALFQLEMFEEAEVQFKQVVDGRIKIYSGDHEETVSSKAWIGHTFLKLERYMAAEEQLRGVVDWQEVNLGRDHERTLHNKQLLAIALFAQCKFSGAEAQFKQVAEGRKNIHGEFHEDTLESKLGLQASVEEQKKYSKPQELLQAGAKGNERIPSKGQEDPIASSDFSEELQLKLSLSSTSINSVWQAPAGRLKSFFPQDRDRRDPYTDTEINEISSLLNDLSPQWSNVPRTYIVLRIIGHLDLLPTVIDLGFSDFWFPVTEKSLPGCFSPSIRAAFVNAQQMVLTKSMDLEKGESGQHCYFKRDEVLPLKVQGVLGTGGFGQVDKVLSRISSREYARKRVHRSEAFRGRKKEHMQQFIAEIQLLKRLKHHHIVEFVGSYTDPKYIGLVMLPVAEMDLAAYLKQCTARNYPELRTFFGCLATALEFLHEQKVRHKDIKPGNILVNCGNVLFADFGLSLDFTDASGSTTTGMTCKTPRYCAPEVAEYEPRNTSSDIWSLGVVFTEMATVLKGKSIEDMDEFFRQHGSHQTYVRTNMAALPKFTAMLEGIGESADNVVFGWTQQMLRAKHNLRLSASSLVASIVESKSVGFCGICCAAPEEEFSDCTDE